MTAGGITRAVLAGWACLSHLASGQTAGRSIPRRIVFTQVPAGRAGALDGERGRIVLLEDGGAPRVLTPDFESAADPAVAFDATRILFAGKKNATDPWNIFEMKADGAEVRQITRGLGNCRSPIYESPIFYLDDAAPAQQIAFVSDAAGITALYSARMDGSAVRRLTYNPSGALDPAMLPDGRILFSSWRPYSLAEPDGRMDLFGVNIDGADYAAFSGGQGRRLKRMACVTPRRQVIFVDADAVAPDGAGPLSVIELRRNLHSYKRLTQPAEGLYYSPSPLPDGSILVARRPAQGSGTHGIYRLDPATRLAKPIFDSPEAHDIQPQAVEPRAMPDGRSSVVDEKQSWGKLYCLSVYDSDLETRVWPVGIVKRIRFLEGMPPMPGERAGDLSPLLPTRFIGEIDVDEDGSFHVQVPANTPIQIQALDGAGMALRSSAWVWAKNKENRGCIGCHEDGERTPENVMAKALTRNAANLTLPPERRRTVDFSRDVEPVLKKRCGTAGCHGGGLDGRWAYQRATPGRARTSPLIWAIFGRNTSYPWDGAAAKSAAAHPTLPADATRLTESERRVVIEWVDLGAHYVSKP